MRMASFQSTAKYKYVPVPNYQREFIQRDEDEANGNVPRSSELSDTGSTDDNFTAAVLRDAQLRLDKVYLRGAKDWKHAFWCCLCCLFLCIVAITITSVSHYLRLDHRFNGGSENFCSSRSCVLAATGIASSLDESVDPCEDFPRFSCGGWKIRNPIPTSKSYYDAFDKQETRNKKALKKLLEEDCSDRPHSAECKTKAVYKLCNDIDAINAYGITPLRSLIDQFDGWSVTGTWNQSNYNLSSLYKNIARYNVDILFKIDVGLDPLDTSEKRILIHASSLTLPSQEYYIGKTLDDPTLKAYRTYMTDAAILLGGEWNASWYLMGKVLKFETTLASIQNADADSSDRLLYRVHSFAKLQKLSPSFDWTDIIQSLFAGADVFEFPKQVETAYSGYLGRLSEVIKMTPPETIQNYVIWHLIRTFLDGMGKDHTSLTANLHQNIYGSSADTCSKRWLWCLSFVEKHMELPSGRLFIEKHFDLETEKMAQVMVEEIKDAFKRNLLSTSWLDEETVDVALEKLEALDGGIGYPHAIRNKTALDILYHEIDTTSKTFFDINVELHKFSFQQSLKKIAEPGNSDSWSIGMTKLNANYAPTLNRVFLPAGILQPPAYKSDYPQSVNFGGIGFVVAHEITHGFDDSGRNYDSHGNLHEWWKADTSKKFLEKSRCLVDQYSRYKSFGSRVNGARTLSENIADNGGLRLAYDAYKNWRATDAGNTDPLLPSLNYTHEQLFFIAFAQVWCASDTKQNARQFLISATHCPNEIRVMGSVRNMKEFADTFHCKAGSKMNPVDKCVVW